MNGYDLIALGIGAVSVIALSLIIAGTVLAAAKAKRERKP